MMVTAGYDCMRRFSTIACDSTARAFGARYVEIFFPQCLSPDVFVCRMAATPSTVCTTDYATPVQILTWFFNSPSTLCPFSVHRMVLAGKELGKGVGQWFGPSTAADTIKCVDFTILAAYMLISLFRSLVQSFP